MLGPWLSTARTLLINHGVAFLLTKCFFTSKSKYPRILVIGFVNWLSILLFRYFKQRTSRGPRLEKDSDDDNSDLESVASEEFQDYLATQTDIDFASEVKPKSKTEKTKKKSANAEEEDGEDGEEDDGDDDLDAAEMDSEEDFDNDEEFQDAFKDFDDMLNDVPEIEEGGSIGEDEDFGEEGGFREEDVEFSDGTDIYLLFSKTTDI